MMYPCAKLGDFSFSRFGFITPTHTYKHITDADDRYISWEKQDEQDNKV